MTFLPVLQNRTDDVPECFGSNLYDPRSSECSGGADITYTDKKTGSHVRPKCDFFMSCGAKVQALRSAAQRAMVPAAQQQNLPQPYRPVASGAIARMQTPPMSQQMQPVAPQPQMMPMQVQGAWYPATTYQDPGLPERARASDARRVRLVGAPAGDHPRRHQVHGPHGLVLRGPDPDEESPAASQRGVIGNTT